MATGRGSSRFPASARVRARGPPDGALRGARRRRGRQLRRWSRSATGSRRRGLASAAVIPNGVDARRLAYMAPADAAAGALFFGNLGYFHNVVPARFVALGGAPAPAPRSAPEGPSRIAGARPVAAVVAELAGRGGVEVAADVPSIAAELHRAAVAVLPVQLGLRHQEQGAGGVRRRHAGRHEPSGHRRRRRRARRGPLSGGRGSRRAAEASARLLESAEERVRLAAAARELVEREYSWEQPRRRAARALGRRRSRGVTAPCRRELRLCGTTGSRLARGVRQRVPDVGVRRDAGGATSGRAASRSSARVRRDGETVALVPLHRGGGAVRTLRFVGAGVADQVGAVCAPGDLPAAGGRAAPRMLRRGAA